ncbi:MAG: type III pantothenate kinase [Proteobacteria bacterium]|jgi:type III pantothenate kinase|nr:type III pantothenate kinase [Pseudomonadota bacterium]
MNLVVVDIGNTKTMLGFVQNDKIVRTWKMATHKNMLADEYVAHFNNFLSQVKTSWESNPVCVASVVPHITEQLRKHSQNRNDIHFVNHESSVDFSIHLPTPQTLGSDLIAAAQGALKKHTSPLIIVDAGTATTITVINRDQQFIGGAICPGMGISSQALFNQASALSAIQLKLPETSIGNKTNDAILSGICLGHASMIEKMIERFESELKDACTVLVTGGAMETLLGALPKRYIFEPTLTLEGLISIYQNMTKGSA